ncbi:MAG: class I adenylate-forming enzyme family protein [Roseiarcus sp.]|jgi:O-succinylbenzoic acid--CoA ligase
MNWDRKLGFETRLEAHRGNRVVRCFSERPPNIDEILQSAVTRYADREAAVSDDRRMTFAELGREVDRLASGLQSIGVTAGDRVALLIPTCVEMTISVFALCRIGAIAVPLDTRLIASEVEYMVADSGSVALIYDASLADRIPSPNRTPGVRRRCVLGGDQRGANASSDLRFETLGIGCEAAVPASIDDDDDALLIYTSGTSGRPKGAVVSHLNVVHSVRHYEFAWGLGQDDRSLLAIPASNITGLVAIIVTLMHAGGCVVYMRTFKAAAFLALASRERATHAFMVPAMYKLCLMCPEFERHDLSAWRLGSYGGAIMPTATIDELSRRIPGLQLMNGYGSTETTSPAVMLPKHLTASHNDSIGLPLPCAEICIMGMDGREVAPGETGELWIKGPMVVSRYWNNLEETERAFVGGYWRSGDLCSRDAEGIVRFHDRLKDSINRGGYKIYSAEIENTLMQHPGVQELAVIAKPDLVLGERVHAVVTRRNPEVTEDSLREFCVARMADYKVPESFTLLDEPLPRNSNGKVLKRTLREELFGA